MANHLSMALIDTILTLRQRGWSLRAIARELDIDRATVARHLQAAAKVVPLPAGTLPAPDDPAAKPANAPIGSALAAADPKPANAPIGSPAIPTAGITAASPEPRAESGPGRASDCEPWRAIIVAKLEQGLTAQRIYQDLHGEHSYTGSYYSVRRLVHRLEQKTPLPFRRLECGAGEEVQIDFGVGAPIVSNGRRRRTHVLRIVLSHSRKGYSEVVDRQTTDNFIRCVENAFWSFGGVVERVVVDNLKAAVANADWFDPDINPKLRSFATHYGVAILPTRPYTPRHKGKVERGVGYVQDNALKGREFASLEEQNAFLRQWEETVADTRVHGTIRQQVGLLFRTVERPALLPLPAERFPCFEEGRRKVQRDGYVEVAKAYYTAPPEYVGRSVWVRWDMRLVRVLNDRLELIATHVRQEPGRFSTHPQHIPDQKIAGVERGADWLLGRIRLIGTQAERWAQAVLQERPVEGLRVLPGLLALAGRHSAARIEQACQAAVTCGAYRLRTIRALLRRCQQAQDQEAAALVQEHPLIRPLADYGQVVDGSVSQES